LPWVSRPLDPCTTVDVSAGSRPDLDEPTGWLASLGLGFEPRGGRTVLTHRRHRGPLTVQRPFYPEGGVCHLYLLHPPGGIVGGDGLEVAVEIADGAHALLTTPGAAKLYRSAGPRATLHQRLRICNGAVLEWLPQENILFPGARVDMRTEVELTGDGRFIGWEMHCFGRPAVGERFACGSADLRLRLHRNGKPLLLERLRAEEAQSGLSALRGYPLCATLIASGASADDLEAVREGLPAPEGTPLGVTLVEDLLIARGLGHAVEPLRRFLITVWGILRPRLLGRPACPPRIWAT
jgi:urease accessory protein